MKRIFAMLLSLACLCSCAASAAADTGRVSIGGKSAETVTLDPSALTADVAFAQGSVNKDQAAADILAAAGAKGTVAAAVNGGFFNAYYATGTELDGYGAVARCYASVVKDGMIVNGGSEESAIYLGFTGDGRVLIDEVAVTLYVSYNGKKLPTWGVNSYFPEPTSVLLFTPEAGYDLPVPANATVAKIVGGKVVELMTSGTMVCTPGTYYYVCGKDVYPDSVPGVGDSVTFTTEFSKSAWSGVTTAVSCGPWLLHDGQNVFAENGKYPYLADQKVSEDAVAARTFAAVLSDGRLLLGACTASPRQITEYLLSVGAKDAMLLDGGASSMLSAGGKTLRAAGRKLNNVLCFYDRASQPVTAPEIGVEVKGAPVVWTDARPFIDANSRTMVPLRAVGDALGLTVSWNNEKREASFSDGSRTIYFPVGSTTARTSSGGTVAMDTAAVIISDRTYAPVRYLAEFFGYSVVWNNDTRTVVIR